MEDVSRMLGRASDAEIEAVRAVVQRFGNVDDLADFDQLVRMGRLEREVEPAAPHRLQFPLAICRDL